MSKKRVVIEEEEEYVPVFQYRGALSEKDIDRMMGEEEEEEEEYVEEFVKETKSAKRKGRPSSSATKPKKNRKERSKKFVDEDDENSLGTQDSQDTTQSISTLDDDDIYISNTPTSSLNTTTSGLNLNSSSQYISLDDDDDVIALDDISTVTTPHTLNRKHKSTTAIDKKNKNNNTRSSTTVNISTMPITSINTNTIDTSFSPLKPSESNNIITLNLKMVGESVMPMQIREKEPIQTIVNLYCKTKQLLPENVQIKLYGLPLDHQKSSSEHFLVDGDLIDVTIKEIEKPVVAVTNIEIPTVAPTIDDPNKLILILRYEGNSYKFKLGKDDQFEKLLAGIGKKITVPPKKSIVLKFDGMNLNLKSTPVDEDMEDEDLIDVVLK